MSIKAPNLDDLRFQKDLVDEARRRIHRYCPEWTDYNLSDPGITLIELFAWMTETMLYRLNRVPERTYIKFMEFLGIQLQSASSARTELTFYLSAPLPFSEEDETIVEVPAGTEVATRRTEEEPEIIFTTDERLTIVDPKFNSLRREEDFNHDHLGPLRNNVTFEPFQDPPQEGDTFYLSFDPEQNLAGHILQLEFKCKPNNTAGIDPKDPPLTWEVPTADGESWRSIKPSDRPGEKDDTEGLNKEQGRLILRLPLDMAPTDVFGRQANWVRCRLHQHRPDQQIYRQSPVIQGLVVHSLGGTAPATNAVMVYDEFLGRSDGEPGQVFTLQHAPILTLQDTEAVYVEEIVQGELTLRPWQFAEDFSASTEYDRHFTVDIDSGEVRFGPVVRKPDGTMQRYGRVPEAGRAIYFNRYRHGGGSKGNVTRHKIQVLKSAIPYIDHVLNLIDAEGGRDRETLDEAKMRAARDMRTQKRAVTAEDFETLAKQTSRDVARVKCLTPSDIPADAEDRDTLPPGVIEILVVPEASESLQKGDLSRLNLDSTLEKKVEAYLNQYRLLTTALRVRAPRYIGIQVVAEVVAAPTANEDALSLKVIQSLRNYLTPLALKPKDAVGGPSPQMNGHQPHPEEIHGNGRQDVSNEGWAFGQDIYVAEVFSYIQNIPGVRHVIDVQLRYRPVDPAQKSTQLEEAEGRSQTDLTTVMERVLQLPMDTLPCSLDHEITIVEI